MRAAVLVCVMSTGCSLFFSDRDNEGSVADGSPVGDGNPSEDAGNPDAQSVGELECDSDTLALFQFEGASNESFEDSCVTPNDLTVSGTAMRGAGQFGQGGMFDSPMVNAMPLLNIGTEATVEAWLKPTSTQARMGIVSWGKSESSMAFRMVLIEDGGGWNLNIEIGDENCAPQTAVTATLRLPNNEAVHLAVTLNGAGQDFKVFVDGDSAFSENGPLSVCAVDAGFFAIGAGSENLAADDVFQGVIDELRISNIVRY